VERLRCLAAEPARGTPVSVPRRGGLRSDGAFVPSAVACLGRACGPA
jgi:hypothetical protein